MKDALTVTSTQPLIPAEKIKDKNLDQMTLPERAAVLSKAYELIEDAEDITDEEMEIVASMENAVEQKVASWGLMIRKIGEASDLCKVEQDYYQQKANEAKARGERFKKKVDNMNGFLKRKMLELNLKKVETPSLTVLLNKKRKSVIVLDNADLEDPERKDFVKTVVSRKWDKAKIKEAIDNGEKLATVKMSDPDFTISIK